MNFYEASKESFSFLEAEYNFNLLKIKNEHWGFEMIYTNQTTGIKITYEYRESCFFIIFYQLTNGIIVENPSHISYDTVLQGYSLDDIIDIRDAAALIKPGYKYLDTHRYHDPENGALYYAADVANNLREYAKDVLNGNFEIFSQVEKIVKRRIKK